METQTNKNSVKTQNPAVRKKISVQQVKLSDQPVGFEFEGKFLGFTKGQPFQKINENTGEIITKELAFALFENGGTRISYVADKGLQDAINMAGVKENDKIAVIKLPKAKIGKGREMNQYDIFALNN